MNRTFVFIVVIAAIALPVAGLCAADNRFDGIWVGKEEVKGQEFRGG